MPRDTCDTNLTKANIHNPAFSDRQRRFLDAYRQRLAIAPAARLASINRTSVYRWLRDPGFRAAMDAAAELGFADRRAEVEAWERERELWREQRRQARRLKRAECP
jgi:hypothetical protein